MNSPQAVTTGPAAIAFVEFQVRSVQLQQRPGRRTTAPSYDLDFEPAGRLSWTQGRFELQLGVVIKAGSDDLHVVLQVSSYFSFDPQQQAVEEIYELLTKNTLAITYPYVRAYVAALTALSGLETVTMPTLNLVRLADALRAGIKEVEEV